MSGGSWMLIGCSPARVEKGLLDRRGRGRLWVFVGLVASCREGVGGVWCFEG